MNNVKVDPRILQSEVSLELSSVVTDTQQRMKTWLESEGYELTPDMVFEVEIRFKQVFGLEMQPRWTVRLDFYGEYDAQMGFGDTVEAALMSFQLKVKENANGNRLPVFLKKKGEGLELIPFKACKIPCEAALEGCRCYQKGGVNEGV